ncbi:MAG: hypothetical protein A4E53_00821 [Pelotomaculum sp. PtaB.Bin104]|nr:MAG: hypothetical protein A4E53_00821 [Pelotomaculum sp. PtaB.Bin104]
MDSAAPIMLALLACAFNFFAGRCFDMLCRVMFTEQESTVGCGEFARQLIGEAGLSYRVIHDKSSLTGRCNFKRKLIVLGYPLESDIFTALFQAAHEVGHAVKGPTVFMSHPILTVLLYLSVILGCYFAGSLGVRQWQSLGVSFMIFGVFWFAWLHNEISASRFAGTKLAVHAGESPARKMVLVDIIYKSILALCQISFCMSAAWAAFVLGMRGW